MINYVKTGKHSSADAYGNIYDTLEYTYYNDGEYEILTRSLFVSSEQSKRHKASRMQN